MDNYELEEVIREGKEAVKYPCFSDDFRGTLIQLTRGCEKALELSESSDNMDQLKASITELRDDVESAQGTLSELEDKFGDICSKLDDVECYAEEMGV